VSYGVYPTPFLGSDFYIGLVIVVSILLVIMFAVISILVEGRKDRARDARSAPRKPQVRFVDSQTGEVLAGDPYLTNDNTERKV
jgi:hypothetical protein